FTTLGPPDLPSPPYLPKGRVGQSGGLPLGAKGGATTRRAEHARGSRRRVNRRVAGAMERPVRKYPFTRGDIDCCPSCSWPPNLPLAARTTLAIPTCPGGEGARERGVNHCVDQLTCLSAVLASASIR